MMSNLTVEITEISSHLIYYLIFIFIHPPTLHELHFCIVALIVSLCWFNLPYLSMFALIIFKKIIIKKIRQRNCRLETLFSG